MNRLGETSRIALLASAAGFCLAMSGPALAQEAAAQTAVVAQDTTDQGTAATGAPTGESIVVTAQKREEQLKDVPISISVVKGADLKKQGAVSLPDYAGYVPGLSIDSGGTPGLSTVTLRGISPTTSSAAVGFYLDDAPVASSSIYARASELSLDLLPYDIQRIEVLRGPQGTLYGASSIGGLLKYVTVDPRLSGFSVRAGVEGFTIKNAGDLGFAAQALANGALVDDKIGVLGSFSYRKTPGWVDSTQNPDLDDQNDYDQIGGRVAALIQATDAFSIKVNAIWQSVNSDSRGVYAADLNGHRLGNGHSNNNLLAEPFDSDLQHYSASLNYDFGPVGVTSISTYSDLHSKQVLDSSYAFGALFPALTGGAIPPGLTPLTYTVDLEKFTQEVRVASTGNGPFTWLVGGFYTHEKSFQGQRVRSFDMAGNVIAPLDPLAIVELPATYEEYAIFGNATFRISDQFDITGGLRWAHNNQDFRQISSGAIVPAADDPGKSSESNFSFSISPQFHFHNGMAYARIATGYRPGGPNVIVPGVPPTVDSDTLTNYELGVKADFADGLASIDVAAFYMDWKDIQVAQSFGGIGGLANGGKATSKGIEGALVIRPARGLTLGFTGAYTDSTLSEDVDAINGQDGDELPNVPKFSGSARVDYTTRVNGNNTIVLGAGLRHTGSRLSDVESDPLVVKAKAYTAVDLNAGYTFNDRWTLRLYARNLFDNKGELSRTTNVNGLNLPTHEEITPIQPRTIGLAVEFGF